MALLDISVLNPRKVIFKGTANSVIVPGEYGVFEILPFHKPILSRLISGALHIDEQMIPLRRGVIRVLKNKVIIIIEER